LPKTGLKIDIGPALRELVKVRKKQREGAETGVGRSMIQLLADSILQAPTVPLDEGTLRGSGSIFVQNKKVDHNVDVGKKTENRVDSHNISIKSTEIIGVVGFNTDYAAKLHESVDRMNFKEPSSGPKFLESKMASRKMTYKRIIVNAINEKS